MSRKNHTRRIKKAANVITIIGLCALAVMAVVGTMAIDIVLLCAAADAARSGERPTFVTGLLWGLLFHRSLYGERRIWPALVFSPITSAVAIGLSFYFAVPVVGIAIAGAWGAALFIFCVGKILNHWAERRDANDDDAALQIDSSFSFGARAAQTNVPTDTTNLTKNQEPIVYSQYQNDSLPPSYVSSQAASLTSYAT